MAKRYVTFHFTGTYIAEVEADTLEDAKAKAWEAFDRADFGEGQDINADIYAVDDEHGEREYEAD